MLVHNVFIGSISKYLHVIHGKVCYKKGLNCIMQPYCAAVPLIQTLSANIRSSPNHSFFRRLNCQSNSLQSSNNIDEDILNLSVIWTLLNKPQLSYNSEGFVFKDSNSLLALLQRTRGDKIFTPESEVSTSIKLGRRQYV